MERNNVERRAALKDDLLNNEVVSASELARKYQVSRQTIVGDIALMRAQGEKIIATVNGYKFKTKSASFHGILVCQHDFKQTRLELETIVKAGGEVLDVTVDHNVYGQLVGTLGIATEADINDFMSRAVHGKHKLLSSLTNGIHLHNIACESEKKFDEIKRNLGSLGLLYKE
ncbi:transcription repressor NadR [Liquorilactobacillus satsumensis]|uniref:transcription repressor NadR n=1 Tax=Liquorilactobacillus satsumensis TaxID=259059 RepID=UPI0021C3E2C1|nr:transcription repressor NadR [Liquorilactobacillus satsumensis]